MKRPTKHLFTTLLYCLSIVIVMVLLYWVVSMPHVEAGTPHKGEVILFVTFDNGLVEETVFGGSFPDNKACVASAKLNYPMDGKPWISYMCIHEDVHEYLESKKNKETLL